MPDFSKLNILIYSSSSEDASSTSSICWLSVGWMSKLWCRLKTVWMARPEHGDQWREVQLEASNQLCTLGINTGSGPV